MRAGYTFLSQMSIMTAYSHVYVDIAVINWVPSKKEFHYYYNVW